MGICLDSSSDGFKETNIGCFARKSEESELPETNTIPTLIPLGTKLLTFARRLSAHAEQSESTIRTLENSDSPLTKSDRDTVPGPGLCQY